MYMYVQAMKARLNYLHEGGERVRVGALDLLNRPVSLLLVAARQDDVIAALAQVARHLVANARACSSYDHCTS